MERSHGEHTPGQHIAANRESVERATTSNQRMYARVAGNRHLCNPVSTSAKLVLFGAMLPPDIGSVSHCTLQYILPSPRSSIEGLSTDTLLTSMRYSVFVICIRHIIMGPTTRHVHIVDHPRATCSSAIENDDLDRAVDTYTNTKLICQESLSPNCRHTKRHTS